MSAARAAVLAAWDFFSAMGLHGLALDFACGAFLAACAMAAVPAVGRLAGVLSETAMRGMSRWAGRRAAFLAANYATFPGVALHELSHAAGAKLTGARVDEIRLFEPDGEKLGYVKFTCRGRRRRDMARQRAVSSCAPVIGGIMAILFFRGMIAWAGDYLLLKAMSVHGLASMLFHMEMSGQDLKNYMKGCAWLFPGAACAFTVIAYAVGHGAGG